MEVRVTRYLNRLRVITKHTSSRYTPENEGVITHQGIGRRSSEEGGGQADFFTSLQSIYAKETRV